MTRKELFPTEERRKLRAEIKAGTINKGFDDIYSMAEEKIYRLKQLLIKYYDVNKTINFTKFDNSCPLCESFYGPEGWSGAICLHCPWRDFYLDDEYPCEKWAGDYDLASIRDIVDFRGAEELKIRESRIRMIYKWIEYYSNIGGRCGRA